MSKSEKNIVGKIPSRALASLVIIMGLMIVAGVSFLLYTMITGRHLQDSPTTTKVPVSLAEATKNLAFPALFDDQFIPIKRDFTLQEVSVQGERLIARYHHDTKEEIQLVVYSLVTAQRLGAWTFATR